ncbi:unnamed protein product [Arctia plantaginis]|uniref:Lysozyme n=1 Tax=Arctia plantaginis TaxID=874455 RepID=A0A8S0ZRJ6_ARCPL|nr:unnamed protein product [Arctia plantaginis]CAB3250744.1 unnamed protein product [Arctia plantaginis]
MSQIIFICIILYMATTGLTRTVSKCELVYELRRHGFPEYQMRDLVCLVRAESMFETDVIDGPNYDGSYDWGLFQINDRFWCNPIGAPGKGCNVHCNDLVSDNITATLNCAITIINHQGLDASPGWVKNCKGKWQPDLNCDCNCTNTFY